MEFKGEVPRMFAVSSPVNGWHYELWRTPHIKPGWHLYGYQNGVLISRKPVGSMNAASVFFSGIGP